MLKPTIFKTFIIFIFVIINSLCIGFLSTIILGIYISLFYFLYFLYNKFLIKNKTIEKYEYFKFFYKYFYKTSVIFIVFYVILFNFIGYQVYYSPPKIPAYILTNGDKKVVFQTMSHIGSSSFYKDIKDFLQKYKNEGYILFYEGVRPGIKENHEKFNKLIGFDFSSQTYSNLSKIYGLINQNNEIFLSKNNNLEKNIDISMDEIIQYYEEKGGKYENKNVKTQNVEELTNSLIKGINPIQLFIIQNFNKAVLSTFLKNPNLQAFVQKNFTNTGIFGVILGKRNEIIANEIIKSENKNIFVMYGMLHYLGVYEILKKNDSKWRVENIVYFNPLK